MRSARGCGSRSRLDSAGVIILAVVPVVVVAVAHLFVHFVQHQADHVSAQPRENLEHRADRLTRSLSGAAGVGVRRTRGGGAGGGTGERNTATGASLGWGDNTQRK